MVVDGTEIPLDSLEYGWMEGEQLLERKWGMTEWQGTAVKTVTISGWVDHDLVQRETMAEVTVTVTPRTSFNWSRPTSHAMVGYNERDAYRWGSYESGITPPVLDLGTGPWRMYYWVQAPPRLNPKLELSHDFLATGPKHPIVAAQFGALCPVPPESANENVFHTNRICGTGGNLEAHRTFVLAHERRHEQSLNICLNSLMTPDWLDRMEGLTARGAEGGSKIQENVAELWNEDVTKKLADAEETDMKNETSGVKVWNYWADSGPWTFSSQTAANHNGTWGCS